MDAKQLLAISGILCGSGSLGGIQRQIHVQPVRSARRVLRHFAIAYPPHLPKLFSARCPVAIHGNQAGKGSSMNDTILFSRSIDRAYSCDGFLSEVVAGLSQPQKTLPCKFLYDEG